MKVDNSLYIVYVYIDIYNVLYIYLYIKIEKVRDYY